MRSLSSVRSSWRCISIARAVCARMRTRIVSTAAPTVGKLGRARDIDGMAKVALRDPLDLGHQAGERAGQRIAQHQRGHEHEDEAEHARSDGEQVGGRLRRIDLRDFRGGEHVDAGRLRAPSLRPQGVEQRLAGQLLLQEDIGRGGSAWAGWLSSGRTASGPPRSMPPGRAPASNCCARLVGRELLCRADADNCAAIALPACVGLQEYAVAGELIPARARLLVDIRLGQLGDGDLRGAAASS